MLRVVVAVLLVAVSAQTCRAGLPFTCQAAGDSWTVVGKADRKLVCNFTCILHDPKGSQDAVTCSATVAEAPASGTICEGFIVGKHWTSATLVSGQCATALSP